MRWMKHYTDARHNPKFRAIERKLGEAGYARAFKLLEIIGGRNGPGEDFVPRLDLNVPHTDLGWLADELEIDRRSAKLTLAHFAKCRFIDPDQFAGNVVYVPQMIEYLDEWTSRRQSRDSRVAPASLPSDSRPSKSESQSKSEITDREGEVDDQSESDYVRPDQKLTPHPPLSSNGKSNVTEKTDVTPDLALGATDSSRFPAWALQGLWKAIGIDRNRVPTKFLMPARDTNEAGSDLALNFEYQFKRWWNKYWTEYLKGEIVVEGTPAEFAEYALEQAQDEGVEYPPILLRRKKELEAA
jgi:hypothetical protein